MVGHLAWYRQLGNSKRNKQGGGGGETDKEVARQHKGLDRNHGVQRRMILVDNFFDFLELNFFAYLLLYVT